MGCEAVGSDVGDMFTTIDDCLAAFEDCDLRWCMVMREEYYVRQVPLSSPLTGGDYEHTGGFGGFEWMSLQGCTGDNCPYWYIDRLDGVMDTPTPGYTPTSGPTLAAVTIEDEAWRTRCKRPGNCGVPP